MDSARWERIQEIFHQAANLPDAERQTYLQSACGEDQAMMAEVQTMLAVDSGSASVLDRGLPEIAFQVLGSSEDPVSPREFGPYRLIRILGEGGMGAVWLAERADAGNLVAIKFLPHAGLTPARRERFTREIKTLAKLKHPYIARLYDAGTLDDGTPWFVMEYVDGVRFTDYCREPGRTIEEQLKLFRTVCGAVQYAHGQEIIHRDLKPSNILVAEDGTPRLLDFGIARELHQFDDFQEQTRPGMRFMSPAYAAPEWAREGIVGLYTDVYSLGVILYEMLTGRLPFDQPGQSAEQFGSGIAQTPPQNPSIAAKDGPLNDAAAKLSKSAWRDLDVLCLKAMHRDAQQRYQSVEALSRDLDHFLKNEPLEARPDSFQYRLTKFVQRNRRPVLVTAAALALVAGLVVFYTVRLAKARNAELAAAVRTQRIQEFMLNLFQGGDEEAGPSADLRVVSLIDRGAYEVQGLSIEPQVQADLCQTLGTMYQKLGKLDRADELLRLSLQIRKTLPEPSQPAVAENLIALGLLQSDRGKEKEAEELVRQALNTAQSHHAHNKLLLAEAESALGYVLVAGGHQAQSVDVLNRAISTMEAAEKTPSPQLSRAIGTLADAQMYLGHYDESASLNRRALAINQQLYGDRDPHIADALGNLAQIDDLRGHYVEAEQYERQALQITESWYGVDHFETARKMITLASTLVMEGKNTEAENLSRQALAIVEATFGNVHETVAYATNALASVELQEKKFADAEKNDGRVVEIYRSIYGDADYRVAVGLGNLASVYSAEKRYPECEQILKDVVQRFTRALGPDNINTGISQVRLGRTLLHEEKYKEAEEHSRAGYEILIKQTSPQTSYVEGARHDLAIIYTALNQPQQAQRFQAELANAGPNTGAVASK